MNRPAQYTRAGLPLRVTIHGHLGIAVNWRRPMVGPAAAAASAGLVAPCLLRTTGHRLRTAHCRADCSLPRRLLTAAPTAHCRADCSLPPDSHWSLLTGGRSRVAAEILAGPPARPENVPTPRGRAAQSPRSIHLSPKCVFLAVKLSKDE